MGIKLEDVRLMEDGMARVEEDQRPEGMEMALDKETPTKSKPNELEGSQQRVIIDDAEPREMAWSWFRVAPFAFPGLWQMIPTILKAF